MIGVTVPDALVDFSIAFLVAVVVGFLIYWIWSLWDID